MLSNNTLRVCIGLWLALVFGSVETVSQVAVPTQVNRDVLALYDGIEETAADVTRIHKYVEMPLNHLGYRVTYWDVQSGLPNPEQTRHFKASVTWFADKITNGDQFLDWAAWAARGGMRFAVFGSLGPTDDDHEVQAINNFVKELGLEWSTEFISDTSRTVVQNKDAALLEFECKLDQPLPAFDVVYARGAEVRKHLSVRDPELLGEAILVATGPGGGFAASDYNVRFDSRDEKLRWLFDPIAFLAAALDDRTRPIPDTTTVSGRRLYFSHIDGDGWDNVTEIEPYAKRDVVAAEIVRTELIAPFPDLPVTIGVIGADVDLDLGGTERAAKIARRLYRLPQVEVASHTYTHPFDWKFFENYNRSRELALEGSGSLPRYRTLLPFDLRQEVVGSLALAQSLSPATKSAMLYLWSGDTLPFEAAVRASRIAGVRNLNGGDSRFDTDHPSLAYVPPISRLVGAERQIHAVNSNENTYTNDWTGPFDGFARLVETLERTELPRRLKGINLYYHMYSGEKPESLIAVKEHLQRMRTARIAPITASTYAAIADDFYSVEFEQLGALQWRVVSRGSLGTIRFDRANALTVDSLKSVGVLGHNRHADALYIALDPAVADPVVALHETDSWPHRPATRPYLVESRWQLEGLTASPCVVDFNARGFGPGEIVMAELTPGRWQLDVTDGSSTSKQKLITVGSDGVLLTAIDADARNGVRVALRCEPQGTQK